MKILIVDDMPTVRKMIQLQLAKLGYPDVVVADNGADAWIILENANPRVDLIISDWTMPVCTGIALLKRVRASRSTKHIPFIMVTAEGEDCSLKEAKEAGVTDYVVKPLNVPAIVQNFKKYFNQAA